MKKIKNYAYCMLALACLTFTACKKSVPEIAAQNTAATSSKLANQQEPELITLKSGVVIEKIGNDYVLQGDILLSPAQYKSLDETGSIFPATPLKPHWEEAKDKDDGKLRSVGVPGSGKLWAMVRYTLHPALTWDRREIIKAAIAHWEAQTNVRFFNATGLPTKDSGGYPYSYVEFVNHPDVNQSSVGRIGGRQEIKLAQYQSTGVAIHEIGHAIGLYHEMARVDRDHYVNINWNNIKNRERNQHNFRKETRNYYAIGSFDFNSVMIYGSYDFALDESIPTITKKDGSTFTDNQVLSSSDRAWANELYLPYKAGTGTYRDLDERVYKKDNTVMSAKERLRLIAILNGTFQPDPRHPDRL